MTDGSSGPDASVLACLTAVDGVLDDAARRILAFAHRVAAGRGGAPAALVVGTGAGDAARTALERGAATAFAVEADPARPGVARVVVAAAARAVERCGAKVVCVDSGVDGAEAAGRLAVRLDAGAVVRVKDFAVEDGAPLWERPVHGGKGLGHFRALTDRVVVGVGTDAADDGEDGTDSDGAAGGEIGPADGGDVVTLDPSGDDGGRLELLDRSEADGSGLADARVVVSGGRGMGGAEGFDVLRRLAELLDGVVGASRAACDAGWVPSTCQVGQTGATVAPELYLAVGISGAGQHLAGITRARTVVAVNPDPHAPIFDRADYGIVEEWQAVLPGLIEALEERGGPHT